MGKSKSRNKIDSIPNTTPSLLQVNIDYDKLAEAFINAQEQRKDKSKKSSENTGFFKIVWLILKNKKDTQDRMTIGLMAYPLAVLFQVIAVVGFISLPISVYVIFKQIIDMTWSIGWNLIGNIESIIFFVVLLFIIFIFSLFAWGASNEIEKSEDKNFVAAVFSGIISLVALVVSLIALKR